MTDAVVPQIPAELVRAAHQATEPLHGAMYFAPEPAAEYTAIGVSRPRAGYFGSRSAAMGAVGAGVVAATFYNFSPSLVAHFVPAVWDEAAPQQITAARRRGVRAALTRILGAEAEQSAGIVELTDLLRAAAGHGDPAGRPLFAAHAELDWPTDPLTALWHGVTLVREYRGDGHIAALVGHGLRGIDAIVTHVATGAGFTVAAAKQLRGWSDEQWSAAVERQHRAGVLDANGKLTDAGRELRRSIESDTDRNAAAVWQGLGVEGTQRVIELGTPWARAARASMPSEIFAAG